LRRTKTQVLQELPSRTEVTIHVELSESERALYEAIRRSALENLSEVSDQSRGASVRIFAELMKLRRACCHPSLVTGELGGTASKFEALCELLEEMLENGHKALVFSQFIDHLALVKDHLEKRGIAYQYLDGSTPMRDRQKRVEAFQAGVGEVFLISLRAGGTGLNLTAADYVIHLDPWWNPAVEDQASDRAHRMGQKRPVTIYRLVTKNSVEERILELHQSKRELADSLLDGNEVANRLSAKELMKLFGQEETNG
jgi:SNF2 family DNA or RNA helicase